MKRILFNWWALSLASASLVAVSVVLALPIFAHPLRPLWARLLLLVIVFAVWGAFALARVIRVQAASEALARELGAAAPGAAGARTIGKRMADALATLRKANDDRRDYLYSRPWYMIIGPSGSGKTTALLRSGLRFPFSDTALGGVAGTRDLDFWFADEAVLVDTAGRYTTQDSDPRADSDDWLGFLETLRRQRPLQPINGVLVAMSIDELLRADRAALDAHARTIRRQLVELRQTLDVTIPVYVLFTKADLLAGFVEFYDDLDDEGRRAVVGATLPLSLDFDSGILASEFDLFAQSIADRSAKRLQEEPDARRRALILGFPGQVETLRARVLRFLGGVFVVTDTPVAILRGFYLTSGAQEGAPIDRLLSTLASVHDQPHPAQDTGRAYFLDRLLSEIVFAESNLVEDDPGLVARRGTAMGIGLAAIAAAMVMTLLLWSASFVANRGMQDKLVVGARNAQDEIRATGLDLVEYKATDPDLEQSLSALKILRDLPGGYGDQHKGGAPFLMTFGLYQGGDAQAARQAYEEALQRILLPRVLTRLETYLSEHQGEPLGVYEALKVYLMLGGQGPFDAKTVAAWVKADWAADTLPGANRKAIRKELAEHLDALLENGQPSAVWREHVAPLDGDLIAASRRTIQTMPLADRAYAMLRQKGVGAGPPWVASAVLAPSDGQAFAAGDAILGLSVPYFFTKEGYEKTYLPGLAVALKNLRADAWVFGPDAPGQPAGGDGRGVDEGVAADYAKDYVAAWEAVIRALSPADYYNDPAAFGLFTRTPSPLKLLLLEVRGNTMISGDGPAGGLAGQLISSQFRALRDYVGDGKSPAPIDDFIQGIKTAAAAASTGASGGGGSGGVAFQAQLASSIGGLAAATASAPPRLRNFVAAAVNNDRTTQATALESALADAYAQDLAPVCHAAVEDRYPFYGRAKNDDAVVDIMQVFGADGAFDTFAKDRLEALLKRDGPVWRWNADNPVGALLDPTEAEAFQRATEIRDLLANGLPMRVEVAALGGAVTAVEFSSGGTTHRFHAHSGDTLPLMWSASSGLPEAHIALFNGTRTLKTYYAQGPWALFRLMDMARQENAGPTAFKATFGEGATAVTLRVDLNAETNPFRRGSLWSFRCPARL